MKGVDFIMGNDIAGGKVMMVVQVTDVSRNDSQSDRLAKSLPVSVVTTQAQAKCNIQESDKLSDSVFSKILENNILH